MTSIPGHWGELVSNRTGYLLRFSSAMGKRNKDDIPNPNSVANRDIIQRLNFLYQASVFLNGITASPSSQVPSSPCVADDAHNPPKKRAKSVVSTADLSRSYVDTMKVIGQKTNVKMYSNLFCLSYTEELIDDSDPTVKRVICKGCSIILIPGTSSTVRVKSAYQAHLVLVFAHTQSFPYQDSTSHRHLIVSTCNSCGTSRRIPAPPILDLNGPGMVQSPSASTSTNIDQIGPETTTESAPRPAPRGQRKKKKPRAPPHFSRNLGHVVFRGNERLPDAAM